MGIATLTGLIGSINHFILPIGYKGSQIKGYFSKNKEFNPLRVNLNSELVNDERLDFIRVLGWTN